jgi:hypothetical protein
MLAVALAAACRVDKTDAAVVSTTDQGATEIHPAGASVAPTGRSMVRLVNAVPSMQKVDLAGDGRTLFAGVKYTEVTAYAHVHDDLIAFRLLRSGADTSLADDDEVMRDGGRYTVIALRDEKGGVQLLVLVDDVVAGESQPRIRVVNAASTVKGADLAILGQRDPIFTAVSFGDASDFEGAPQRTVTIVLRLDLGGTNPVLLKNLRLAAGKAYTIVLAGGGTEPLDTFTIEDAITDDVMRLTLRQ